MTLFILFFLACCAAGATGAMFQPGDWYDSLDKPDWTPPDWVFPVTWTTLYFCMAIAGARVAVLPDNGIAMALWALQIALNTLWTPIFFGLRRLKSALIVIAAMWLAVAGATYANFQLDFWAGLLFVPYLVWVSIAGVLNFSVMRRNPGIEPVTYG
jgi:tryptophan-rich sensory protein